MHGLALSTHANEAVELLTVHSAGDITPAGDEAVGVGVPGALHCTHDI
jgi:hypothetical protein